MLSDFPLQVVSYLVCGIVCRVLYPAERHTFGFKNLTKVPFFGYNFVFIFYNKYNTRVLGF